MKVGSPQRLRSRRYHVCCKHGISSATPYKREVSAILIPPFGLPHLLLTHTKENVAHLATNAFQPLIGSPLWCTSIFSRIRSSQIAR